jgi:opacity protein-like surface antigen
MNKVKTMTVVSALASLAVAGASPDATAQDALAEVSVMGGLQVLNENDTALPDRFVNIPVVATVSYNVTPILAVDGEFTWMIPVEQGVSVGSGPSQDRRTPNILAYQANARANWPIEGYWSPYLAVGAGAVTVLSGTDADRLPQLAESETAFALNFGAGVTYDLNPRWALRADFREFVAFPSENAGGLSDASGADEIWMERGTVGVAYRF